MLPIRLPKRRLILDHRRSVQAFHRTVCRDFPLPTCSVFAFPALDRHLFRNDLSPYRDATCVRSFSQSAGPLARSARGLLCFRAAEIPSADRSGRIPGYPGESRGKKGRINPEGNRCASCQAGLFPTRRIFHPSKEFFHDHRNRQPYLWQWPIGRSG